MNIELASERPVYTVTKLTRELKTLIEDKFSFIWISGEISNLAIPASGHCYFTLKDKNSQINAVIFRNQARNLKFKLEDGLKITGLGRLSIYEPRGTYQFILEYMEPEGIGSIQLAFEQLKNKLDTEGLFKAENKKKIPFLPQQIGVITSPSGAVIRDIIKVISRRFENIPIEIYPVKVQGIGADEEIVSGIKYFNTIESSDVIIIARGGGSLEDLAAFNSEIVTRAIYACEIPVISAVGHETDFTIADFVSDLRAPTPSVAAELAVPEKKNLLKQCTDYKYTLLSLLKGNLKTLELRVNQLRKRLTDPRKKIQEMHFKIDDYFSRLLKTQNKFHLKKKESLSWKTEKLFLQNPKKKIEALIAEIDNINYHMITALNTIINANKYKSNQLQGKLNALNPNAILNRGYSITRKIPGKEIIYNSNDVNLNQELEILVAKGKIICRVEGRKNGQENI